MGLRLLALACLVGAAFAGPFQRQSQCATRCLPSSNEKFHYEPGKKYVYNYEGVNHLIVAGQQKQQTEISGQAEIHVKTKCEMVLKLKNTKIEQKATQEEIAELIREIEIPLPYSFQDGKIEHICSSEEESTQSLNIKKGILSALINSMTRLDESEEVVEDDSLGRCRTKYTVRQSVIEKEKHLKSCTNRHSSMTSLITNPYDSPDSAIHSAPIFPTDKVSCKQTIEEGIIKSCACEELASIRPLGQKHSLVEFEGSLKLTLTGVEAAENLRIHPINSQQALKYNLQDESSVEDIEREVEEVLRNKCAQTSIIDLSASKDFIFLVSAAKRLSYEALQRLYSSLENGQICSSKKITDMFLDALPMAGSDGAIRLMVNLLVQQRVTGLKAKLWSASLALVNHPSHEAIKAVVDLVKEQKSRPVLLGVSAMVYRHCLHHTCVNSQSVKNIVTTLNQVLGQRCSFESEDEAVAVLKAFGNMGQVLHAEQNIMACASDNDKPIRVRLAAIDAFRRVNKKRPEEMLRLYTDPQVPYEVRIAALSSVLSHADDRQIATIKSVAEHETHEQVSAYAGTLIANMNKTSCPLKKEVRRRLNKIEIETPSVSYWENSKNIELSTFSETLNVGGAVETDIIHSPETKVPRSIYTRFDLDVFDNHLNLFEIGLRAEGLEAAFKKLIGFREAKKQRSAWSILKSSDETDDEKLEAQFFFRTMNTEIVDFAVSDLNSMGEMLQIADVLNKLSHEKSADFSHSFMFVNSKLVIPSVTGRSYSFGLTGSATVGLVAKSKVDIVNILSRSKNCDVHGHFQPSVNVELAATVGMHTEKPRPDVKIVTRVHSESHIEAQFKIKDNHLGLVKVSVPSENIAYTKISSDIYEIDAHHQEKPVYDTMQKKIDYCFDKLEKPLGLSVCGKWEVPKPFMSNTFPFIKGVGNMELSIKKTDVGMQSYEFSVEIPRRKSPVMTYKASLDTPGSRINRRFSADLEVRTPTREQKQLSLQVRSPFRSLSASATGYLTNRRDLIEGSFDIQAGSFRRCSIKASSPITETSSEKTYKPSIEVSYSSSQPLKVDGTVTVSKGRKHQIYFDMKANKPSRKPVSLKGTIIKEGVLSASKSAEWKLSTDVALKSPIVNLNVRSSTEKQSRQSHKISSTVAVDYQTESSKRESVKLVTNLQKSSTKISSMAQFETTKYPSSNFILTWNMQGKWKESIKNDVTFKYGTDPEHHYINLLHSTKMYQDQPGECKFAIKAPQFDIDSDLTVTHEVDMNSKLHADVDLRYMEDKHVKAKLHVDKLSERPLKLKMKAEIQTPERRMFYQDELEEISQNSYKGNAVCEWSAGRRMELQYKYQKLSDRSKLHHEIETSLRLPSSRSPIKHKASIEISPEKVGIEGRVSIERRSEYSLKAELNKKGSSYVNLKVPKLEGNLKLINDEDKKTADIDLKSDLFRRHRHITASASLGLGNQKKFETEICLDADRKPEDKFLLSTSFEKQPRNKYQCRTKLQISDKVNFEISTSGERDFYGEHEMSAEGRLLKFEPMGFTVRKELTPRKANFLVRFSKNMRPKVEMTLDAERSMDNRENEVSASASLKSLDNSFPTKKWSYKGSYSQPSSGTSMSLKSNARFEWSPRKIYECETNFDLQPNVILSKAYLHTPHINFEKQSIGFSYRKTDRLIVSSASVEFSSGKSLSITSETHLARKDSLTSTLVISSPFEILRDAKIILTLDNKPTEKSLKSSVDVNGSRKADVEFSLTSSRITEIKGHVRTTFTPEISTYIKCENNRDSFKYDVKILKDSIPLMSASLSKQASNQDVSYSLQSSSQEKTLVNLKLVKEVSSSSTKHKMEAQGVFPEISLSIESSRKDKNSFSVGIEACHKKTLKSCYTVKAYHKALLNEENYLFYRKVTVDMEKISENTSPKSLASLNIVSSIAGNDAREKFIVEMKEKKIGYEVRAHLRENEQDHCSLDSHIFTPYSTIRVRGSILHNDKSTVSDFEIVPDASVPTRKLGYELKREKESNEVTGYLKLYHPEMRKPVHLSGHIRQENMIPVAGKVRLNYSSRGKDLILEILPEQGGRRQERKAITYKVYREDKTFEASAKLMEYSSRLASEYSCDWAYLTKHEQKQGKLSLKFSDKMRGIPRSCEVELITPGTSTKLSSHLIWQSQIPTGLRCALMSNNEEIYEIELEVADDCLNVIHHLKSREFIKHDVCVFKKEHEKMTLLSVQTYYQRHKSLDLSLKVDEDNLANIDASWDTRSFWQALRDLNQVCTEMISRYFSEEDLRVLQSKLIYWTKLCQEVVSDAVRKIKENYNEQCDTMKLYLNKSKVAARNVWSCFSEYLPLEHIQEEFVSPLIEKAKCMYEKYIEMLKQYYHEHLRAFWQACLKMIFDGMRASCPPGTFCYEFADAIERMEVERMKLLVSNKVTDMKRSVSQCLDKIRFPDLRELLEEIAEKLKKEVHDIMTALSEGKLPQLFIQYLRRLEHYITEKAKEMYEEWIDWVIRVIAHLERDQDFRVLKSLYIEYKEWLLTLLKKGETVLESIWAPVCENLRLYSKKWVNERVVVREFSPSQGSIALQIRQPFESKHIQLFRNIYVSMKNKINSV